MLLVHSSSHCDVCLDPYDWKAPDQLQVPHAIPCGHIFCKRCLQTVNPAVCPLCRKEFVRTRIKRLHVEEGPAIVDGERERHMVKRVMEAFTGEVEGVLAEVDALLSSEDNQEYLTLRTALKALSKYTQTRNQFSHLAKKYNMLKRHHEVKTESLQTRVAELEASAFDVKERFEAAQKELEFYRRFSEHARQANPLPEPPKPVVFPPGFGGEEFVPPDTENVIVEGAPPRRRYVPTEHEWQRKKAMERREMTRILGLRPETEAYLQGYEESFQNGYDVASGVPAYPRRSATSIPSFASSATPRPQQQQHPQQHPQQQHPTSPTHSHQSRGTSVSWGTVSTRPPEPADLMSQLRLVEHGDPGHHRGVSESTISYDPANFMGMIDEATYRGETRPPERIGTALTSTFVSERPRLGTASDGPRDEVLSPLAGFGTSNMRIYDPQGRDGDERRQALLMTLVPRSAEAVVRSATTGAENALGLDLHTRSRTPTLVAPTPVVSTRSFMRSYSQG